MKARVITGGIVVAALLAAAVAFVIADSRTADASDHDRGIAGAWYVDTAGAPFLPHASKATNTFTSNLIVTFKVTVRGDRFEGPAQATYYDAKGKLIEGPYPAMLKGQRITTTSGAPVLFVPVP